jgi:hypothetical protein
MSKPFEKFPSLLFGDADAYKGAEQVGLNVVAAATGEEQAKETKEMAAFEKAQENHKAFLDSIIQSKSATINGQQVKPMKGVNYHNLKYWNDLIRTGKSDFTKHIVWAYKILWETSEAQQDKGLSKNISWAKNKKSIFTKWNNLDEWKGLHNPLKWIASKKSLDISKALFTGLEEQKISWHRPADYSEKFDYLDKHVDVFGILDEFKELAKGNPNAFRDPRKEAFYFHSPVKRFFTDKMESTMFYDTSRSPEWLGDVALAYVPKEYELYYWLPNATLGIQHFGSESGPIRNESVGTAYTKNLQDSPSVIDFIDDSNIQQLTEDPAAWTNLGLTGEGTKGLWQFETINNEVLGKVTNPTKAYYSVVNPYFPANNLSTWNSSKKGNWVNGVQVLPPTPKELPIYWAPFSAQDLAKIGTVGGNETPDWKATSNPFVSAEPLGFFEWSIDPAMPNMKKLAAWVYEHYPPKYINKVKGIQYDQRYASWLTFLLGPQIEDRTGKEGDFFASDTGEAVSSGVMEAEVGQDWLEIARKVWQQDLNMGGQNQKIDHDRINRGAIDGGEAIQANLLNPVFKVQTNTAMMALALKFVIHITDMIHKGAIPFKSKEKALTLPFTAAIQPDGSRNFDDEKDTLKAIIGICWTILESFEKADAKIREIEKRNSELDAKSDRVVKGEARKRQIQKNMQCFMLNIIDVFQSFHEPQPYSFMQITGDSSNIFNLLGYKPQTIDKMLRIKPDQLAKMQPRIKVFKERKVYKKNSNVLEKYDLVEVKGPFATHTDTKSIEAALSQGGGRSLGGGITEVNIIESHGDADFDVRSTTEVEIKFIFNTLQEIFLNFPNIDEKGKITFPYGRQPRDMGLDPKNVPASFAELIFPLTRNLKKEDYLNLINTHREEFNVVLELGWSPPDNLKNLTPFERQFFKDLNKQNLYRSYLLEPYDAEFNFTNEGQVELTARYFGIERSLQKNIGNRLFPKAGQASDVPLNQDEQVKKDVAEVKKLSAKKRKKPLSSKEEIDLQKARHRLDDAVNNRAMFEFENFIRKQLNKFLEILFDKEEIYVLRVPRALLGARDDNNILKWSPTQDIEALKLFPKNYSKSTAKGYGADVSSKVRGQLGVSADKEIGKEELKKKLKFLETQRANFKAISPKADFTEIDEKIKKLKEQIKNTNVSKAAKEIQKAAQAAAATGSDGWDIKDNSYPIYWVYFGDLVQSIFDFSEQEYQDLLKGLNGVIDLKGATGAISQIHVIMGTVKMPIIKGGKYVIYNINIADIPIVTSFVTSFVVDSLVSPSAYYITKIDFVTKLFRAAIQEYFNTDCFVGSYEVNKTSVERSFFSAPSSKKDDIKGIGGIWNLSTRKGGPKISRTAFKNKMLSLETKLNKNIQNISTNPRFKYCFLGTRAFTEGSFNFKKDLEENIHHFYFGAGEGLVKSVNFASEELPHQTEALILEGVNGLDVQADAFVPRIFNCNVTMIGNTLFNPGHTFYFDPTMGTVLGQIGDASNSKGINIIKNTGLGGYFYVSKVEHRLSAGSFETTLEGIKTGITKKKVKQADFNKEVDLDQVKPKVPENPLGKLSLGDIAKAGLSKLGDEFGL